MKALSILQPWAWLIVTGQKDIENRSWPTKYRGKIWVHAGKTYSRTTHEESALHIKIKFGITLPTFEALKAETGGLVGSVVIADCVSQHPSRWKDFSSFGFVLERPIHFTLLPLRGQLGFFDPGTQVFLPPNLRPELILDK